LDALIRQLEKRKIAATARPHKTRPSVRKRHIPASARRAVWERDRGQCTFVGANGTRCEERRFLEFDHIEPVARGGEATAHNIRLRCRTHNQYEAERAFGAGFMAHKRRERGASQVQSQTRDVLAGLRNLGCRPGDARRAADYAATLPLTSLEERMRAALQFIGGGLVSYRPLPAG
jgi:5-methylcytosine-specific restriction endonuclease McrA